MLQVAQEDLLLRVHSEIDLRPSGTEVVEGHGTDTTKKLLPLDKIPVGNHS